MRSRIVLATVAIVTVTVVVGVVLVLTLRGSVARSAEAELSRQAVATAGLIEEDLAEIDTSEGRLTRERLRDYRTAIGRSLHRAQELGGHDVVEAAFTTGARTVPIGGDLTLQLADIGTDPVTTVDTDTGSLLVAVEQVDVAGGVLTVWIGRTEPLFPTRVVLWVLLAALAVGAVLSVILAGWFARSLSLRLGRIESAADAISAGDLSARTGDATGDEIGDLARAFDTMADRLEEARSRERSFLLSVGHDLRTPLTSIRGYAEALDDGLVPPERADAVASALHRQTDVLSRLVEDVMLLARLESAEFTLRIEPADPEGVVRGVVESHLARAAADDIDVTIHADVEGEIDMDPDRFSQIVSNLMDNAIRYTPAGGSIAVSIVTDEESTSLRVQNSGEAISSSDLPHVFERLYVADRYRAQRPAGSGLGLAIVSDLVSAMGGSVTCRSNALDGTVFEVVLDSRLVVPT